MAMPTEREQKLVDICFAVAQHMLSSPPVGPQRRELAAEWTARQLRDCGFDTQPIGSSWGVLTVGSIARDTRMAHDAGRPLTHDMEDSVGCVGTTLAQHVGKQFAHDGNGKTYTVVEIVWDSPKDLWALAYREMGVMAATVTRDHLTFFGLNSAGRPRFHYKQP